ncbi:MAG: urease accessory protein UreF [Gammaproteobacteria bacterium]|jgi:urease accessory protein|nr:urease accessory protein UreF [Gammaproteobacteria bacterium]
MPTEAAARSGNTFRLFQLISPSLPVGAFAYSQGLEWAIEAGWVDTEETFAKWLAGQLQQSIVSLELPMLNGAYTAAVNSDWQELETISQRMIAWRETKELRLEEGFRGAALARLLPNLGIDIPAQIKAAAQRSQIIGLALAGVQWQIQAPDLCRGYIWSWLENAVMAGVKLIPLGQTQGQQILQRMVPVLEQAVQDGMQIDHYQAGSSAPAMAIASSNHEIQYTRLFRS